MSSKCQRIVLHIIADSFMALVEHLYQRNVINFQHLEFVQCMIIVITSLFTNFSRLKDPLKLAVW